MTRLGTTELLVSYSQLAAYNRSEEHPYSDWTDEHVGQGFAWREGSVSFGTLGDVRSLVELELDERLPEPAADAVRVIVVPFRADGSGIAVSSILSGTLAAELPAGLYELQFEAFEPAGGGDGPGRYRLAFAPAESPAARIVRQDEELDPPAELVLAAEAAV
ncbi:competence protein ComJ [Paenibacillus sp. FSL W8-1187]|uniref:competence protein ComJ n=1 Tax=unclassified Paenibacillus TaxID=185978 RepID=UPI00129C0400|nr:competence protein ComJ [Paenibacillus sp. B01]QGG55952.1 competence protein [Paenibacillus sp. B01]